MQNTMLTYQTYHFNGKNAVFPITVSPSPMEEKNLQKYVFNRNPMPCQLLVACLKPAVISHASLTHTCSLFVVLLLSILNFNERECWIPPQF